MKYCLLLLTLFITSLGFCQVKKEATFKFTKAALSKSKTLDSLFKTYEIWQVENTEKPQHGINQLNLVLADSICSFSVSENKDLVNKDFVISSRGKQYQQDPTLHHLNTVNGVSNECRISIANNFILGEFRRNNEKYFIEQLRNFIHGTEPNLVVIYKASDEIKQEGILCGVKEAQESFLNRQSDFTETGRPQGICRTIDYAIAVDYSSFQYHNSNINETTNYILSIMNMVEGNYVGVFNDDLYYKISEIVVFTSTAVNPWPFIADIQTNLNQFTAWSSTGFTKPYDVSSYWYASPGVGQPVGLAWVNTTCRTDGYKSNVIREYGVSTNSMRCLVAHEIGHNFGCAHTNGFIMNPTVNNATTWAPESISTFNSTISGAGGACITACNFTPCETLSTPDVTVTDNGSQLIVGWTANSNPTRVEYRTSTSGAFTTVGTFNSPVNSTSISHNPVCNVIEYFQIRVSSVCPNNNSSVSTLVVKQAIGANPPPITGTITTASTSVCNGANVTFTATTNAPTANYQWKVNGNNVGINSSNFTTSGISNGDVVSCNITATSGCFYPISATSNNLTMTVTPVTANYNYSKNGLTVNFINSSNCATSYNWQFGNGNTSITPSPVHTYSASAIYNVCLTANQGLVSNQKCMQIPIFDSWTDNLNSSTDGEPNLITHQTTFCDGEAYFNGSPISYNDYPVIRFDRQKWIPSQGTIEMLIKVQNGYTWFFGNSNTSATIFAIDSNGLDKSSFIVGYANGNVVFRRFNQSTQSYIDVTATGTAFRFNEWHVISVSYGASGTIIRVDGVNYVTNTSANYPLNNGTGFLGGANFSDGANWWGIYGFKGHVDKFRLSYTQSDWLLALAIQPPTATISASSSTICAGTSVTFTATTNAPSANYQWRKNGVNVGANTPTYIDNTLTNGNTINCVITATSGCFSTPVTSSNTISMVVNNPVTPTIAITVTRTTPCVGETVIFTASPVNGGANPVYQWKRNGLNVATGVIYSSNALTSGDVISCTMTTSLTCVTTQTANSNTITITIRPITTPSVSITATNANICASSQVTFTATSNVVNAAYQWKINGINIGTNTNQFVSTSLNNNDIVNCVVTAPASDCYTVYTQASNSIIMQVRPLVTPSITISSNDADNILCEGQAVVLNATITNGGPNPVYQWKKNGVLIGNNSPSLTLISPVNNDELSCTIVSNEVCLTANNIESNKVRLEVVQVNPSIISAGYTLFASPTRPGATWQWYKDGQVIGGATDNTFTASAFGNYTVAETYRTCNKISTSVSISPFSGNASDEIKIYPNPANAILYAQTKNADIIVKSVRIYDAAGKLLLTKQFSNSNLLQINVEVLSSGLYMIVFDTNSKGVSLKFIKH